jgi:hypothetical protein
MFPMDDLDQDAEMMDETQIMKVDEDDETVEKEQQILKVDEENGNDSPMWGVDNP